MTEIVFTVEGEQVAARDLAEDLYAGYLAARKRRPDDYPEITGRQVRTSDDPEALPMAYLVVKRHGAWEGFDVESVWLDEAGARSRSDRLNGPEHLECGVDACDCLCRYGVLRVPRP